MWWERIITTYAGYEKGFLPHTGGLDAQPNLLAPTMAVISSAMKDEDDIAADEQKAMQSAGSGGSQSVLGKGTGGYSRIGVPKAPKKR